MDETLFLPRFSSFKGAVHLPGSKSVANRALLAAALSSGETCLTNLPAADDVQVLEKALLQLGVEIKERRDKALVICGVGGAFPIERAELNLQNAGTALRPLTAILAAGRGHYLIDGNEQMRRRPIIDLVKALRQNGVNIVCSPSGCPPVVIEACGLPGGRLTVSGRASSQYVSALLMAAPLAAADMILELAQEPVSKPYIDLTLALLQDFGIEVQRQDYQRFQLSPAPYLSPGQYFIEGDSTAATYFLAAGALPGCGPLRVWGTGSSSRQGDRNFVDILRRMGAEVNEKSTFIDISGPPNGQKLQAVDEDMNSMPDAALTLAVLALFAAGESHIRNIANLRLKESERIHALHQELQKLGAQVVQESDALHIIPPATLKEAVIHTYNDHRIAMAFSLAAAGSNLYIKNPHCVSKTYPNFFTDFLALCQR